MLLLQTFESVATVLEENTQETIDDWYQRLGAESYSKVQLPPRQARASHLPALFVELIHRLRNPVALARPRSIKGCSLMVCCALKQGIRRFRAHSRNRDACSQHLFNTLMLTPTREST